MNKAMTIAGSDSAGGAGIQADLKTLLPCKYMVRVTTSVTAQNTLGVTGASDLTPEFVGPDDAVLSDIGADSAKQVCWPMQVL